tara:strand:- start:3605 stop:4021 length:417 start_codon:yes stop_codon:yes gene_type:complete
MNWFLIAIIGAITIAIHQFSITKLVKFGLPINWINAIIYTGVAIILVLYYLVYRNDTIELKHNHILWIIIGVISIVIAIIATLEALSRVNNPGYVGAILSTSAIILTLLSIIYLKSPISMLKSIGIVLVLIGATFLGL